MIIRSRKIRSRCLPILFHVSLENEARYFRGSQDCYSKVHCHRRSLIGSEMGVRVSSLNWQY
jgi:hypothetical protein